MKKKLLSVCIRAYNQEKYIAQALEGVLMQKTNFPIEVIIGDDYSTDNTYKIIKKYSKKNQIFRIIRYTQNIGSTKNLRKIIEASEGKYVALCDGDDYWIDPYKLQKQVNILESHPEYVGCFHNVINLWENGKKKSSYFLPLEFPTIHNFESLVNRKWFIPINGELFVRKYVFFPEWFDEVMNDDYVLNLALARSGNFYYMPDIMAVYRHHENNESNSYSNFLLINNNLKEILEKMKNLYPPSCASVFERKIADYEQNIKFINLEKKYPWRKYLRIKTYKKYMGTILKIKRRENI